MKEISIKRLLRFSFVACVVLLAISFVFNIGIASATSLQGNISAFSVTETISTFGLGQSRIVDWSKFTIAWPDYQKINWMTVQTADSITYPKDSDSTPFTIIGGGTGAGYASYHKASRTITWVFTSMSLESSILTLSYQRNIFSGFPTSFYDAGSGGPLIMVLRAAGGATAGNPGNLWTYETSAIAEARAEYNLTQIDNDHFYITVLKNETYASSKILFHNDNLINYFLETTFNLIPLNITVKNAGGIWINLSMASGASTKAKLVDINNNTVAQPTPTPTPTINPSTGGGVLWDKISYLLNENAVISYIFSDSAWYDFAVTKKIEVFDNDNTKILSENALQSGTVKLKLQKVGKATAQLNKYILGIKISTYDSADTTINPEGQSYILINNSVPVGTSFNISYRFGHVIQSQGTLNSIIFKKYSETSLDHYTTISLNNTNIIANTEYNISALIGSPGRFKAELYDISRGVVAETIFNVIDSYITPTKNITTSYISSDKDTYYLSESLFINFGIDNTNFSKYPSKYISIKHNSGNYPETYIQIVKQEGAFYINPDKTLSGCTGCFGALTLSTFISGANTITLRALNASADITLASKAITITQIDNDGYGLDVTPSQECIGKSVTIKYNAPAPSTIRVILYKTGSDPFTYNEIFVNGTNKTYTQRLSFVGSYFIHLIDSSGTSRFIREVKADNVCATAEVTTIPSSQKKTDELLGSGFFVAMLILIMFAAAGHIIGGLFGAITGFGAGFIMASVYGLVPMWSVFLFAIVSITAFAIVAGKGLSGGGGG